MPGFLEESRVRREARNRTGGGALAPTGAVSSSKPRRPCAPDSAPAPTAEPRQAADRHRVAGNPFDAFLVNNELIEVAFPQMAGRVPSRSPAPDRGTGTIVQPS